MIRKRAWSMAIILLAFGVIIIFLPKRSTIDTPVKPDTERLWVPPDTSAIPKGISGAQIRYGRELLEHTGRYFGPNGTVAKISNGMNCQNCHLNGGTKMFGNNYASFIANYPKIVYRSGKVSSASQRIAECFERSLNGHMPESTSKEVLAMLAYMKWVGKGVKRGETLFGSATKKPAYMDKAADPLAGQQVFTARCKSCHGANGKGLIAADGKTYTYPPLWGSRSFNDGAGMFRLGNMAAFIKDNMPLGVTYKDPQLTDAEAWNVAAYIESQPRPHKDQRKDWPDVSKKPIDIPYGPYIDTFSETQHKYGPFKPIIAQQKTKK